MNVDERFDNCFVERVRFNDKLNQQEDNEPLNVDESQESHDPAVEISYLSEEDTVRESDAK